MAERSLNHMIRHAAFRVARVPVVVLTALTLWAADSHAQPAPTDQPMTFVRLPDTGPGIVVATGTITSDTATAFANFATQNAIQSGAVWLHSDGGDLEGGLALGRSFRALGLSTVVAAPDGGDGGPGRCVSACALAFLGGEERSVLPGSTYGVHRLSMNCIDRSSALARYPWLPLPGAQYCPEFDEGLSAVQSAQGDVTAYIAEMGIDPRLLTIMSGVASSEIRELSTADMTELGVIRPAQ